MRAWKRQIRSEEGSTIVLTVVGLAALLGMAALAVDVGVLLSARTEAQSAADAAALAGAVAFVESEGSASEQARSLAVDFATRNAILHVPLRPEEVSVDVVPEEALVRVQVRRSSVSSWFARVLGVESFDIATAATARADETPMSTCVKPFTPPDPLLAGDRDWRVGDLLVIKGDTEHGEAYAWAIPVDRGWTGPCPQGGGAPQSPPAYRANICKCNRMSIAIDEPQGRVAGSAGQLRPHTREGVEDLIAQDPGASWDSSRKRVVGSRFDDWRESPRVVTVPLHDPGLPGWEPLRFTRFVRVFVEGTPDAGTTVTGRYVTALRTVRLTK